MEKTVQRSQYWQMVRGVCIFAVIAIHCPTGGYTKLDYNAWIILREVLNFPVAIFIFMAGYFITPEKVQGNYIAFYLSRAKRLLLPYFVWSGIYLIGTGVMGETRKMFDIISALVCGDAAVPLYYIVVLVQLTIITPWLLTHRKSWMYLITPIYLLILYTYNLVHGFMPVLYETLFPAWFFFYLFGMDCRSGKYERLIKKISIRWILVFLIISTAETYVLKYVFGGNDSFVISQIRFGSFMYAAAIALWLQKCNTDCSRNILAVLGDYSYGIYYCHMIVLWIVSKLIALAGLNKIWIIHFGLSAVLTLIGSFVFIWIARWLAGKLKCRNLLLLLGF